MNIFHGLSFPDLSTDLLLSNYADIELSKWCSCGGTDAPVTAPFALSPISRLLLHRRNSAPALKSGFPLPGSQCSGERSDTLRGFLLITSVLHCTSITTSSAICCTAQNNLN